MPKKVKLEDGTVFEFDDNTSEDEIGIAIDEYYTEKEPKAKKQESKATQYFEHQNNQMMQPSNLSEHPNVAAPKEASPPKNKFIDEDQVMRSESTSVANFNIDDKIQAVEFTEEDNPIEWGLGQKKNLKDDMDEASKENKDRAVNRIWNEGVNNTINQININLDVSKQRIKSLVEADYVKNGLNPETAYDDYLNDVYRLDEMTSQTDKNIITEEGKRKAQESFKKRWGKVIDDEIVNKYLYPSLTMAAKIDDARNEIKEATPDFQKYQDELAVEQSQADASEYVTPVGMAHGAGKKFIRNAVGTFGEDLSAVAETYFGFGHKSREYFRQLQEKNPAASRHSRNMVEDYVVIDGNEYVTDQEGNYQYSVDPQTGNKISDLNPPYEKLKKAAENKELQSRRVWGSIFSQGMDEVYQELPTMAIGMLTDGVGSAILKGVKASKYAGTVSKLSQGITKATGLSGKSQRYIGSMAVEASTGHIEGTASALDQAREMGLKGDEATAWVATNQAAVMIHDLINPMERVWENNGAGQFFKKLSGKYTSGKITKADLLKESGAWLFINTAKNQAKEFVGEAFIEPFVKNKLHDVTDDIYSVNTEREKIDNRSVETAFWGSIMASGSFSAPTSIRLSKGNLMKDAIKYAIDNPEALEGYYEGMVSSKGVPSERAEYFKNVIDQVKESELNNTDKATAATLIFDRQNASLEIDKLTEKYGSDAPLVRNKQKELAQIELDLDKIFDKTSADGIATTVSDDGAPDDAKGAPPSGAADVVGETPASQESQTDVKEASEAQEDPVRQTELKVEDKNDFVNPIDATKTQSEKADDLHKLSTENKPIIDEFLSEVDSELGTTSKSSFKSKDGIINKANRATIKKGKPYYDVEHVRDSFRFKTVINSLSQLPEIFDKIQQSGKFEIIKADFDKLFKPKEWGFRIPSFDVRMPNGQIVEYYFPIEEIEKAKKTGNHELFEKWRNKDIDNLTPQEKEEYDNDNEKSNQLYQAGWEEFLSREGFSESDLRANFNQWLLNLSSDSRTKLSFKSSAGGTPLLQWESSKTKDLKSTESVDPNPQRTQALPSSETDTLKSEGNSIVANIQQKGEKTKENDKKVQNIDTSTEEEPQSETKKQEPLESKNKSNKKEGKVVEEREVSSNKKDAPINKGKSGFLAMVGSKSFWGEDDKKEETQENKKETKATDLKKETAKNNQNKKDIIEEIKEKRGIDDEKYPHKNVESNANFIANKEKYEKSKNKKYGKKFKKKLPNGEIITGRYVLVNKNDVFPSHNPKTFRKTIGVPVNESGNTYNDNDYETSKTAQLIQQSIANNYDRQAIDEVVLVDKNGVVKSGNGRTISRQISTEETSKEYVSDLKEEADRFGFTESDVEQIGAENVMLIVEIDGDPIYNTKEYAKYNPTTVKQKTPLAQAKAQSKQMDDKTSDAIGNIISQAETVSLLSGEQKNQLKKILINAGIISEMNQTLYFDEDNNITDAGGEFIENLILASIFNENELDILNRNKAIRNRLARAKTELSKNSIKEDRLNVIEDIKRALYFISAVDPSKNNFSQDIIDYIKQGNLFEEKNLNPNDVIWATLLQSQNDIKKVLSIINSQEGANTLFGEVTSEELLQSAINNYIYDEKFDNEKRNLIEYAREFKKKREQAVEELRKKQGRSSEATDGDRLDGSRDDKDNKQDIQGDNESTKIDEPSEVKFQLGNIDKANNDTVGEISGLYTKKELEHKKKCR